MNTCRVCSSPLASAGRLFKPYVDFETSIYDCALCGCRFANRDEFVYERLHSRGSSYSGHQRLCAAAKSRFEQGDIGGLAAFLNRIEKNRPIIEHLDKSQDCRRVLEFGCSLGYLSSYAILLGKEFYGVDVSETAVAAATKNFGDHFSSPILVDTFPDGYFDFIYHVGTIGCVDDPVGFVKRQIRLLRSGGTLLFNAPNLDACHMLGLDWLIGTTPPDLVTLFPSKFWSYQFSNVANVSVSVSYDSPLISFRRRKLYANFDFSSSNLSLFNDGVPIVHLSNSRDFLRTSAKAIGRLLPPLGPFAPLPKEFGVSVRVQAI